MVIPMVKINEMAKMKIKALSTAPARLDPWFSNVSMVGDFI